MFRTLWTALLAAPLLMAGGMAATASRPAQRDVSLAFADHGGIRDWRADGSRGIYVQDQHSRWYYARLMNNCLDLPYADRIGFDTRGTGRLDKFGTVVVRGQRCPIATFARAGAPVRKHAKG